MSPLVGHRAKCSRPTEFKFFYTFNLIRISQKHLVRNVTMNQLKISAKMHRYHYGIKVLCPIIIVTFFEAKKVSLLGCHYYKWAHYLLLYKSIILLL